MNVRVYVNMCVCVQILDLPVEWLQNVAIIDTPGTNAIIKHHEQITSLAVPRSVFCSMIMNANCRLTLLYLESPLFRNETTRGLKP